MRAFKRYSNRGFTLVELMIVVAIIGVLAALAIYGVSRYLASAKTSEAKNTIGALVRGGIGAFERETTASEQVAEGGTSVAFNHDVCSSGAFPAAGATFVSSVPAAPPLGTKYQPVTKDGDFDTGTNLTGWRCMKFTMSSPIYYQYTYVAKTLAAAGEASATGWYAPGGGVVVDPVGSAAYAAAPGAFEVSATGNVDGDTLFSHFSQSALVNTVSKEIKEGTQLYIYAEYE